MLAGRWFQSQGERLIGFLAVLLPLCLALAAPLPSFAQSSMPRFQLPEAGSYPGAVNLDPAFLDSSYMFRFSSSSPWRPLDRVLVLDAFPGEHRQYRLELLSNMTGEIDIYEYAIDRRPPEAPVFFPASGDVGPALNIALTGEGSLILSLNAESFTTHDPEVPIHIQAPSDGSSIVTAVAYALDEQGNSSLPGSATWRLSSLDTEFLPPFDSGLQSPAELRIMDKVDGLSVRVSAEAGANPIVILDVPEGMIPVISVQKTSSALSQASFIRLLPSAGRARAELPVPWGYDLELSAYYGYEDGDDLVIADKPVVIQAQFPYRGPPAPPANAPDPVLSYSFGATVLSWPPSLTDLYFSLDGSGFMRYQTPLLLPYRDSAPYELQYQAANDGGRSAPVSMSILVRPRLEAPAVTGARARQIFGLGPTIQAKASSGTVRFESTMDGSEPGAPGAVSPALADSPVFAGVEGKTVHYRLRLAAVDDEGNVGPERYLDFSVDREAPPVPVLSKPLPAYSVKDLTLALDSPELDALVYLSVTDDETVQFQEYRGPVVLSGSDDGRKRYVVRAFAEDEFGNRSAEMQPVTVLVDRSSLYVDPVGRSGATGTPDDPLPSLQDALLASAASGRSIIYLRGNHVLDGPVQIDGNLRILGGFATDWTINQREYASIRFSKPLGSDTAGLRVSGGALELRSVGFFAQGTGVTVLIDAKNSSLDLTHVSLAISGGLEATAIRLDSSRIAMNGVDIAISSVVTGRALDTMDSDCTLEKLAIAADSSVRLFDALRMVGGQSSLHDLRIDASPGLAFSGVSLSRARVFMTGSAFFIKGGASSLRLFNLNAASLTSDTLFGDIAWLGEAELFRLGSSSVLRLAHATVLGKAKKFSVVESRDSEWTIVNSIFNADSPAAIFASGIAFPGPASVSANCLWGFTAFLSGSGKTGSIAELNRYASSGYPNFIEAPGKTFSSTNKGLPRLSDSSACTGAAAPLPWSLPADLGMKLRPQASRDIGVDGLREGRL